jgi:hypothetical protein
MVCEMTSLHCLVEIKEITVGGATSGILYNCLPKLIITLRGLDSYTTCIASTNMAHLKEHHKIQDEQYHTIPRI